MQKDSVSGTLIVATVLCVACSLIVASAAVILKPRQVANKELDIKKNLLLASGLVTDSKVSKETILEKYKMITAEVIELETGAIRADINANDFDQRKARKDPTMNIKISSDKDSAGLKQRSKLSVVYKVIDNNQVTMLIFPILGKGLWSTLYGFIALSGDLNEIKGIGFYEHGETPGLGGEIDNPNWKAQWVGKKAFNLDGLPQIKVIKGQVQSSDPESKYQIDGLSGATITSNGVTGLVQYWLGSNGFGPYIENYRKQLGGGIHVEN